MSEGAAQPDGPHPELPQLRGHVIIAGFGIVGHATADDLRERSIPFCIVEQNPHTISRCRRAGMHILSGDIRQDDVLRRAGIDQALVIAVALPDEGDALRTVAAARRLNPTIKIIARCTYSSAGLQAMELGADGIVVAEQVVAREFAEKVQLATK